MPATAMPANRREALHTVWKELWTIHEKHYSIDLPFLHREEFLCLLNEVGSMSPSIIVSDLQERYTYGPALVLAFLALTARFQSELLARFEIPYVGPACYAQAAFTYMLTCEDKRDGSIMQRIQALLMLGYHEWTAGYSERGRPFVEAAAKLAYGFCAEHKNVMGTRGQDVALEKQRTSMQLDSQRRVLWSCFLLRGLLSDGHPKIDQNDFLGNNETPCSSGNPVAGLSDQLSSEVPTSRESKHEGCEYKTMRDLYMHVMIHYFDVRDWDNSGGRRAEPRGCGPWNPRTKYHQLDKRLREIKSNLPEGLQLMPSNTNKYLRELSSVTSRTYCLIHAAIMISTTTLVLSYMPRIGYKLIQPEGPKDEPLVTETLPGDQPNYWVETAQECFEYVRGFTDMLQSFRQSDLVVESRFMGFAVSRAAWTAMYCHHLPKMDPSRALNSTLKPNVWDVTNQLMKSMGRKVKIVSKFHADVAKEEDYYTSYWREWQSARGSTGNAPCIVEDLNRYYVYKRRRLPAGEEGQT